MKSVLYKKIKECKGCLSHLRMSEEIATRKKIDSPTMVLLDESPFAQDRDRILKSQALRRLSGICHVFPLPDNIYIRNRLTHTLEVESVAVKIAHLLGINEKICSAAALGHDIGHTPFGHVGEDFITDITGRKFRHEVFSVIVAQQVERRGHGLNLTKQTLEGMFYHSRGGGKLYLSKVPEYDVVMLADKLAYLLISDIEDMFRYGYLQCKNFPELSRVLNSFGANPTQRINTCVAHLCLESATKGYVSFSDSSVAQRFDELKDLAHLAYKRINRIDRKLCPKHLESAYTNIALTVKDVDPAIVLALMTDQDVIKLSQTTTNTKTIIKTMHSLPVWEIIQPIRGKRIDFTKPNLDW
ncbi:MAG: hypothetical protein COU29_01175 [Candidatus Magasanikbacteria bacterium CG10_big_fil_rev_8_21_14_0_10_36_32]|uniref:HD domain-containing protein n=1 Tax=Candidatus Magasanikbacteria bacterium CG10_big_fil_rev_8_21_14_0_10_36_32 TaxID=1974646 RepID=A0A2M6W6G0_9BACT|nr:MAG: hypothetical protein COU29_01175 [Candidatus Magasanikbacteria bacterium CG10_big_fil_rev_8_21_14_0_10_36_32]